jgi:hypothetical protein
VAGLGVFVERVAHGMAEIQHFAELNEVSARSGQAWVDVAKEFGLSQESTLDGLTTMNSRLAEAVRHLGRGRMLFERFGFSAKDASGHVKSLDELIGDIADKMASVSAPERLLLARRFGLDPKWALLMEGGRHALEARRDRAAGLNPLTDGQYEQAVKVERVWHTAEIRIGVLSRLFGAALFPALSKALTKFTEWAKTVDLSARSPIVKFLTLFVDVVMLLVTWLSRAFDSGMRVWDWLKKMHIAIPLVSAATAVLVAYKLGGWLWKVWLAAEAASKAMRGLGTAEAIAARNGLLLGLALLLAALAAEAIYGYFVGKKSVVSILHDKFPAAVDIAVAALAALTAAWVAAKIAAIQAAIAQLVALGPIALLVAGLALVAFTIWYVWNRWDKATSKMKFALEFLAAPLVLLTLLTKYLYKNWEDLTGVVRRFIGVLQELSGYSAVKDFLVQHHVIENAQKAYAFLGGPDGSGPGLLPGHLINGGLFPAAAGDLALATGRLLSRDTHITQNINAPITVHSTDPVAAGDEVQRKLDAMKRDNIRNAQSGVYQ